MYFHSRNISQQLLKSHVAQMKWHFKNEFKWKIIISRRTNQNRSWINSKFPSTRHYPNKMNTNSTTARIKLQKFPNIVLTPSQTSPRNWSKRNMYTPKVSNRDAVNIFVEIYSFIHPSESSIYQAWHPSWHTINSKLLICSILL